MRRRTDTAGSRRRACPLQNPRSQTRATRLCPAARRLLHRSRTFPAIRPREQRLEVAARPRCPGPGQSFRRDHHDAVAASSPDRRRRSERPHRFAADGASNSCRGSEDRRSPSRDFGPCHSEAEVSRLRFFRSFGKSRGRSRPRDEAGGRVV